MAIDDHTRAEVVRLHRAEGWSVGAIARHLGIHHSTVRRALEAARVTPRRRRRQIDPWIPFIEEELRKNPDILASNLYRMVHNRGYTGGSDHFRHIIGAMRPRRTSRAAMRLTFYPGEQGQVDWGDFGPVTIGRAERRLMGFVLTLSYSRRIVLRFFHGAAMSHFLAGHIAAFETLNGVPRSLLYDNLKSVVTARRGRAITYNPTFIDFFRHYAFEAPAAWPRNPRHKGRVERSIGYVRTAFMPHVRVDMPLDALNESARAWCDGPALERPWPGDRTRTVRQAFEKERRFLTPLPDTPFPAEEMRPARVGATPFVLFDKNSYSVPPGTVHSTVTVAASPDTVRILDGATVIGVHQRCYGRQEVIEDPAHIAALTRRSRAARQRHARDRLLRAVPALEDLFAASSGHVGLSARAFIRLLDIHGAAALAGAVDEALKRSSPHVHTVRHILEERHHDHGRPPWPVDITDPRARSATVRPSGLDAYDTTRKGDDT